MLFCVQVVGVLVNTGANLTFGGTDENCGMLHLYSAGKLGPVENKSYSKPLADHLEKHFNIPSGRSEIFVINMCITVASNAI